MSVTTVYLHGFSGEGASLEPFARSYSGDNFVCINLPGFGGSPSPDDAQTHSLDAYSEAVWREIRKHVPEGKVRLVGHSHGTMVGFVLSLRHAKDIERLDLFCPVARPRLVPRSFIVISNLLRRFLPPQLIIRLLARQMIVDLVTRYSLRPEWPATTRERIIAMRRKESQYYSPIAFDLMSQTRTFERQYANVAIGVPTRICYAVDDNVSGSRDHEWYQRHTAIQKIKAISGGHLCVVADPAGVVKLFGKAG